jgi:hypothetical protein
MTKSQQRAMVFVAIIAVFALPAYAIITVVTVPFGLGIIMMMDNKPWILNLYPFLYAGKGHWSAPVYYFDTFISYLLTIVQWTLNAWLSGIVLRNIKPSRVLLGVLAVVLVFGVVTSAVLSAMGIKLMGGGGAHT